MKPDRYTAADAAEREHCEWHLRRNGREVAIKSCAEGCCETCDAPNPFLMFPERAREPFWTPTYSQAPEPSAAANSSRSRIVAAP